MVQWMKVGAAIAASGLNSTSPLPKNIGSEIDLFTGKRLTTATGGDRMGVLEVKTAAH